MSYGRQPFMTDVTCNEHSEKDGIYKCEACGSYFCPACIKTVPYSTDLVCYVCPKCGGKCDDVIKEQADKEEDKAYALSFWTELTKIPSYPLRNRECLRILFFGFPLGFLIFLLTWFIRILLAPGCFDTIQRIAAGLMVFVVPIFLASSLMFLAYLIDLVFRAGRCYFLDF